MCVLQVEFILVWAYHSFHDIQYLCVIAFTYFVRVCTITNFDGDYIIIIIIFCICCKMFVNIAYYTV